MRLKVEYQNNFEVVRIQELENRFKDSVANPGYILKFYSISIPIKLKLFLTHQAKYFVFGSAQKTLVK